MFLIERVIVFSIIYSGFTFADENPCLIPTPKDNVSWYEHHELFLDLIEKNTDDHIIWIGDSIIEYLSSSTLWGEKISTLGCLNLGIGGDRVEHILWRIDEGEFDFKIPIQAVVIFVGTNNIGHNTPEDIAEGIINLVVVTRDKLGEDTAIILPTLLPKGQYPSEAREDLTKVNRILLQRYPVNPTENVHVVIIGEDAVQPDGTLLQEDFSDFTHPTDLGYTKYFTAVFDYLVEILN